MRALVWNAPGRVSVADMEPPHVSDGEVLVAPEWCGICGSDLHIIAGEHSRAKPGMVLGHEVVAIVAADGPGYVAGERVAINPMFGCGGCDACSRGFEHACPNLRALGVDRAGGLAEQLAVPSQALRRLPQELDLERAALIEPLAVAVRAVRRSRLQLGDRVHVVGGGPIGRLVAACAAAAGAGQLTLSEVSPHRRRSAAAAGIDVVDEPDEVGAQVVFDATGHPSVSPTLARWARVGGHIVIVAAYPVGPMGIDLLALTYSELELIGTRVYTWEDIDAGIGLLVNDAINVDGLVTSMIPLDEVPAAIARLRAGIEGKVLVTPRR